MTRRSLQKADWHPRVARDDLAALLETAARHLREAWRLGVAP